MIDKVIVGLCVVGTAASAAYIWLNAQNNPLEAREKALERRLAAITPKDIDYKTSSDVDYVDIMARIAGKPALWRELIPPPPPPPPPPPKPIPPPDLRKMLQGVAPSLREQIGTGDEAKPRIRWKQNKRGEFMGVGDKINGVEILRVRPDHVLFGLTWKDGKEYSIEIPRK